MIIKKRSKRLVGLALQGGGSHGAFTWGVLDRLVEEDSIAVEGISGVSAGAMNAAVFASGYVNGGAAQAQIALSKFWEALGVHWPIIGVSNPFLDESGKHGLPFPLKACAGLVQYFSPYQVNPLDINPLRQVIREHVDFEAIRHSSAPQLYIGATHVKSGKLVIFENESLSDDVLLASACIPVVHHAVEVKGEAYWDGGFCSNPAVSPLIHHCRARDIMLVLLQPLEKPGLPTTASDIFSRISELSFSATFTREMREIAMMKRRVSSWRLLRGRFERRIMSLFFHMIEDPDLINSLDFDSRFNTDLTFLEYLKERGQRQATVFLDMHQAKLGRQSSFAFDEVFV